MPFSFGASRCCDGGDDDGIVVGSVYQLAAVRPAVRRRRIRHGTIALATDQAHSCAGYFGRGCYMDQTVRFTRCVATRRLTSACSRRRGIRSSAAAAEDREAETHYGGNRETRIRLYFEERSIYSRNPIFGASPGDLSLTTPRFVCFIAWDARSASADEISRVAVGLLRQGAVYVCTWGPDCERVHDIIDEEHVCPNPSSDMSGVVMTTWHATESLAEAIRFALVDGGQTNSTQRTAGPHWVSRSVRRHGPLKSVRRSQVQNNSSSI